MTTTFENARVGDKVWSVQLGWGEICAINTEDTYSIEVENNEGRLDAYSVLGICYETDTHPSLFWSKPEFETPKQPVRTKPIHGVEVPDISFQPLDGDEYYYPTVATCSLAYGISFYEGNPGDAFRKRHNLCYPYTDEGFNAAQLHSRAMLGIAK